MEWQGVPVMPGAISGEGDASGYQFVIQAGDDDIQAYYEAEMKKLGWSLFAVGEGETKNLLLLFQRESEMISVAILHTGDVGDHRLVMFTR